MATLYDNKTGRSIARTVLEDAKEVGAEAFAELADQVLFELRRYPEMMPEQVSGWETILEVYNEVCVAE